MSNFKTRLSFANLLRCIHHFKSDLIDNMDNMHISGTEPSSVILSQTKKLKSDAQKCQNQAQAKRDGVINLQNHNFKTENCSNATNQPK